MKDIRKVKAVGNDNKKWNFFHSNKLNKEASILVEWHDLPKEIDNQEVEVIKMTENKSPTEIIFNNITYTKAIMKSTKGLKNTKPAYEDSSANYPQVQMPYNFVPLNKAVITPKIRHDNFSKFEGNSGFIDVTIKNLTPLYIKGVGQDHFKIGSHYAIPGSSLRGMLRTLVEMVTWSKFQFFNDKFISYRKQSKKNQRVLLNRQLGFLTKVNNEYRVEKYEGEIAILDDLSRKFEYVLFDKGTKLNIYTDFVGNRRNTKTYYFTIDYSGSGKFIKFSDQAIKNYQDDHKRSAEGDMKNLLDSCLSSDLEKKCKEFEINGIINKIKYIGLPIWYEPAHDQNGKEIIVSFGHCKNYRVPHNNSIKNGVENGQPDYNMKEMIDFAESIFGIISSGEKSVERAGKVYVEDAISKDATTHQAILQILSSPYPKNPKIYLAQNTNWNERPVIRGNKLYWHRDTSAYKDKPNFNDKHTPDIEQVNYNKTRFRKEDYEKFKLRNTSFSLGEIQNTGGERKRYVFTKKISEINNEPNTIHNIATAVLNDDKVQFKFVNAINKGATFKGRIRFDNLTNEELGALLFVLRLPDECRHKIGTGKSIGMGSIEITPTLHLTDRRKRYEKIFDVDNKWNVSNVEGNIENFLGEFTIFMSKNNLKKDLWNEKRMQALKALLTYSKADDKRWLEKTNYMTLEGFKNSHNSTLPSAVEIHNIKSLIK